MGSIRKKFPAKYHQEKRFYTLIRMVNVLQEK